MSITKYDCISDLIHIFITDARCESVLCLGNIQRIKKEDWLAFIDAMRNNTSFQFTIHSDCVKRIVSHEDGNVVFYLMDNGNNFISWISIDAQECIPVFEDLLRHF